MAGLQQMAPRQHCHSKDDTAHPHQPGARPFPPHPDPAHSSSRHHPAKAKDMSPLRNRIFMCYERLRAEEEEEEEEEEEDLFVFNDTIEGPRAPAVKPGRVTQA